MSGLSQLFEKPWLTTDPAGDEDDTGEEHAAVRLEMWTALRFYLAVATVMFTIIVIVYLMRMGIAHEYVVQVLDWRPLPEPGLLWFNTAILVLSSMALQWALGAARRGRMKDVKTGILAGGALAFVFLIGQLVVWRQLVGAGYFMTSNPANAFFYLITTFHGLHMFGGLVALGRTADKVWAGAYEPVQVTFNVFLCAIYWHFLLLAWLLLFTLLIYT